MFTGWKITERISLKAQINKYNEKYIKTKAQKMEHLISI
jgi:GTP cyclohydrolase II